MSGYSRSQFLKLVGNSTLPLSDFVPQRFFLVRKLRDEFVSRGFLREDASIEQLFDFRRGTIIWNVPPDLPWMNAPGSIWKSYYPPKGTIEPERFHKQKGRRFCPMTTVFLLDCKHCRGQPCTIPQKTSCQREKSAAFRSLAAPTHWKRQLAGSVNSLEAPTRAAIIP